MFISMMTPSTRKVNINTDDVGVRCVLEKQGTYSSPPPKNAVAIFGTTIQTLLCACADVVGMAGTMHAWQWCTNGLPLTLSGHPYTRVFMQQQSGRSAASGSRRLEMHRRGAGVNQDVHK